MADQTAAGLEYHREIVDQAIRSSGLSWTDWPELTLDEPLAPDARLSALLLLLSAPRDRSSDTAIDRLRRRRLPWDAATSTLAVRIVAGTGFDGRRAGVALRAAEQVCEGGTATEGLLSAVRDLKAALIAVRPPSEILGPLDYWQMPETLNLIERVLSAATPPDILDLAVLRDGDGWGAAARETARSFPADVIAPLVRLLTSLGPGKPTKAWRVKIASCLATPEALRLLREWLTLAAHTDVVSPDEHAKVGFAGAMLFAMGNDDLARAVVFAAREIADEPWVPELLGILARRGSATSGVPGMTGALALGVASAAVDTLAARATLNDRAVLGELFEDLTRRDLVKRIAKHLGLDEDVISHRDQELRRTKAANVRRKADPAPRQARAVMDALIRQNFAPVLRQLGFTATGRTYRRVCPDRVDVIAIGSTGMDRFHVSYGTRFATSWPARDPSELTESGADIRRSESHGIAPDDVRALADRLPRVIVPFLDSMGRYEFVRSFVENESGAPAGSTAVAGHMCPNTWEFLGPLALSAGDRETAVEMFTLTLDFVRECAQKYGGYELQLELWNQYLETASRLPDAPATGAGSN